MNSILRLRLSSVLAATFWIVTVVLFVIAQFASWYETAQARFTVGLTIVILLAAASTFTVVALLRGLILAPRLALRAGFLLGMNTRNQAPRQETVKDEPHLTD
jgi:hypothetical protein